ncbi:MoxR family ATPase [Bacillus salacetis]|uniref:MoxR family ATPase n=1 Tax=Bacillus salacetis TaxID=2315464 RepID=A0A3A1QS85_9BACI|nr:MoxR family ATPase [Bacillus salacetis]RIW30156.1 MoxR family ATPase [Bacillus salacetis]
MFIDRLKKEIGKVMIGMDKEIEILSIALLQGGHILFESVPGTGKTMLAKTFAGCVQSSFRRIQFTPDVLPSDVTGIQYFNPKEKEFELRPGPVVTNVLLADEINRATPRTQSSLLEVMEEKQVTIEGSTLKLEDPFIVLATQNPVESQQGTFPLPAAQLDRFLMKVPISYPEFESEREMLRRFKERQPLEDVQPVITPEELKECSKQVKRIHVSEDIESYILQISRKTREHELIELGVSPRASLALLRASQGMAFISERAYVTPEDVKKMAAYVLSHRISLTPEASLTKTNERVMEELIEDVLVPVESRV